MTPMRELQNVLPVSGAGPSGNKEPVRIAQVLNRMDTGGIETVVMNYYRHIDRAKVQFDFYFAADSSLPQREELQQLGAGLYPVPSYTHPIAYHRALYAAFRQHGYRVVHSHLSTMSVFPLFAAWRAGAPVRICHNHSTAHWSEGKKTLLKYKLRPFNKLFATDWFACGETAGRWMYGGKAFDAGRVTVMPNAIDTAKYAYDPAAREVLRRALGIPQNAFVAGHVGRFTYAKNHPLLLRIFAGLLKAKPDALLLLVGEGELEAQTRQQVKDLGLQDHVIFTGVRQDANKLYSVMDVFCLPSRYEGMPVVAWEAQANGLPCVASRAAPKEAAKSEQTVFLALDAPLRDWTKALLSAERTAAAVPDITSEAERIQEFYLR